MVLETLDNRMDIKDLSVSSPESRKGAFDADVIFEGHWDGLRQEMEFYLRSNAVILPLVEVLADLKIVAPNKAADFYPADEGDLNKILHRIQELQQRPVQKYSDYPRFIVPAKV